MIQGVFSAVQGRQVLLLQGPLGPFFKRLSRDLQQAGAQVYKIDFNGGDWLFSPRGSIKFRGHLEQWPLFFEHILDQYQIDTVMLFGDCRPIHQIAHKIAAQRKLEIGVFEEGYIRPDFITLEKFGVNGYSQLSRNPDFYLSKPNLELSSPMPVSHPFWYMTCWSVLYYVASVLLKPIFRHYKHHRPLTLREAWPWLRGTWRKYYFAYKEKDIQSELTSTLSGKFFLVALQVHNDAQIHVHSDFDSVEAFIEKSISSFAQFAPEDTYLIIKHHPLDRGYHDYSSVIRDLTKKYAVEQRVRYIHDQHLPTLLKNARGVILVNSTVGLSALHHRKPLMVCGTALYDMPGLSYQGSLDKFWNEAENYSINDKLYHHFQNYLIEHTQLNGNFYRRLKIDQSHTGLINIATNARHLL